MSEGTTSAAEARAALNTVERRRRQVIDEIDMPAWYWWGLALGWVAVGVVTDLASPWLAAVATFFFGTAHAAACQRVIGGRRRSGSLSVRADLAGRDVPLLVIGSLVLLGAMTVAGAWVLSADGAGHPVTVASVMVATVVLLGGPRLMAAVRRRAVRSGGRA